MPYKQPDPSKHTKARIQRTEAYAEKVRRIYAATVNEILKLNLHRPDLDNDVMYSFDNDTKKVQREVELLLRRLHSAVNAAIVNGIELEWGLANKECDAMVRSIFGQRLVRSGKLAKYMHRNGEAMQAFINRMDGGMNLSDRVWRDSQHLRAELEAALTVGMGEGLDTGSLSRRVRQYLNDPDLMMRRFSYKERKPIVDEQGNITGYTKGEWKRKWKKRIADPDKPGRYKWIDVDRDNYIPKGAGGNSRGVYKSAAKNSMRLARTETNMAYRNADHERWQQMDFVLGQRVILSLQHPAEDICDLLSAPNKKNYGVDDTRGVYPKEFRFEGWHPQCFCFVSPILADEQAMEKSLEATLRGEEYEFEGQIEDYNDDFKEFVRANEKRITDPKYKNPYCIEHNQADVARILRGDRRLKMAATGHQIIGYSGITTKEEVILSNGINSISKKCGLFENLREMRYSDNIEDGVLLSWGDGVLTVSKAKFKLNDGEVFCPVEELKSAIDKLHKGLPLSFNEEYSIECLYHESVHSKAAKMFPKSRGRFELERGTLDEIIAETCTQLYARENYRSILNKYGVAPLNYESIKYNGYGYKETCNLLREHFEIDGKIQVGELINIANETTSGSRILYKKLKAAGWSKLRINKFMDTLRFYS